MWQAPVNAPQRTSAPLRALRSKQPRLERGAPGVRERRAARGGGDQRQADDEGRERVLDRTQPLS